MRWEIFLTLSYPKGNINFRGAHQVAWGRCMSRSWRATASMVLQVLIVQKHQALGQVWSAHLLGYGITTEVIGNGWSAIRSLAVSSKHLVAIDLHPNPSAGFAVADYAVYRLPKVPILFIAPRMPWADPTLLLQSPNICGVLGRYTPPEDAAAMIARHAASAELS